MQADFSKSQNFSMSYTTTSGKNLSFSMYDKQSVNFSSDEEGKTLILQRQFGFSFSFEGSKLTQTELDEIKTAVEEIKPLINEFLENSKVGELNPEELISSAMQMADLLPTPKDENHKNAIMNHFSNSLSQALKEQQNTDESSKISMLKESKKLINEILEQMQKQLEKQNEQESNNSDSLNLYA